MEFTVLGSPAFQSRIQASLAIMPKEDRAYLHYWSPMVWDVEPPGAWIWLQATSPGAWCSEVYGPVTCGSVLLHEGQHHQDYRQCIPPEGVGGVESEARALRRQADYAERMGDSVLAEYVRSQIGVHGANYSHRFVNPHCTLLAPLD